MRVGQTSLMSTPVPEAPNLAVERLRQSRDAILLVDRDGRIIFANPCAAAMFGYEIEELLGSEVERLVPERFREGHVEKRQPQDGQLPRRPKSSRVTFPARKKDGEIFDAEISLTEASADGEPVVCTTVFDVTDPEAANAYFRNLLESAPDAMIIVDEAGMIEIVNRQCEKMFGYSRAELIGQCVDVLLPERLRGDHAEYRNSYWSDPHIRPMGQGRELAGMRKDGSEFPVEISLSPVRGPDGERVSSVIRDVTYQKCLEADLIEARKAAERANLANTAFLTAASHDLRQPVQALSLLNGALRRTVKDPLASEMIESQQQSLDAMTNLLNSLLDISRLDAGAIEPEIEDFPMSRLVDRLSAELGRQASQKGLKFFAGECAMTVRSDPNLLAEIIQNLVSNAIRYTEKGGEVRVSCRRAGGRLCLSVRDTGIGIDADELEEIFREFHKAKRQGSNVEGFGLGLAIVRRLADLLRLEITVDSQPGEGSRFSVFVPLAAQEVSDEQEERHVLQATDHGGRIILIEDDPNVSNAWSLLLKAEGFVVDRAVSVAEAEDLVRELDEPPHLIISDYHLIDGSTGVDAVQRIRTTFGSEIPAFIVSGDTSKVVDDARSLANSVVMRKPVNTDLLLHMARNAVESGVVEEN